jgi:S1-C subfamily serine protease
VRGRRAMSVYLSPILALLVYSVAYSQSVRAIADTAFRSVVLITMEDANGRRVATASGFFIREDLVATNFHVIDVGVRGHVKIVGANAAYSIAGVVSMDQGKDLAVLKIVGVKAPNLRLGSDADARVGDKIYAVGNPLGLEGTFSDGIVSGIRRDGSRRLLQITAPISPGSSGGPVLNETGQVIGIAVATITAGQNLNFAIPISDLGPLLANLGRLSPLPGTSRLAKAAAEVVKAAKEYKAALARVLTIYENELARREELTALRSDLFRSGALSKREFEEGELAIVAARTNVKDTRQAIEDADRLLKEAEEALKLTERGQSQKSR